MTDGVIHILLVEDDSRIAQMTAEFLTRYQVVVSMASDGKAALRHTQQTRFDAIVLDLMLPDMSGLAVCEAIRARSDVPIIIVTALGEEPDRVIGIERGADDYVTKPFSARELLARIRAVVRRARGQLRPLNQAVSVGQLRLDPATLRASLAERELELTSYEFSLLYALAERAGQVLSREQLLDLANGGADEAFDRSIDVRIWKLRQKLGDNARQPRLLKTVRGAGYVLTNGLAD
ncbi:response regulator transcription factor [Paludibaculum fermentans]|uniref:response regulator transcription factor n=1 Tax=Paludibaculum fermentans TaxID=1473598 RepID=UPI003EBF2D4E